MKIVPVPRDDHRLVAHRRDVGAAGGARAHHDRDLRDALRRHPRLVEEDPPEVLAVGEDLGLERQERAARVDEVEARQPVLLGDLLRAQVLLHREREVRAALHGRVVRDDHALPALDDADAGDDPGRGRLAVVQLPGGERAELEERGARVDQPVDPLARGQLAARAVALDGDAAAASATSAVRSRSSATSASIRPRRRSNTVSRVTALGASSCRPLQLDEQVSAATRSPSATWTAATLPSNGAVTGSSIFIASRITSCWRAVTRRRARP